MAKEYCFVWTVHENFSQYFMLMQKETRGIIVVCMSADFSDILYFSLNWDQPANNHVPEDDGKHKIPVP